MIDRLCKLSYHMNCVCPINSAVDIHVASGQIYSHTWAYIHVDMSTAM